MDQSVFENPSIVFFGSLLGEFHHPVFSGKQGEIFSGSHIVTRVEFIPLLAHKNIARSYELTCIKLHAKALCSGIPTVFGRPTGLFEKLTENVRNATGWGSALLSPRNP